MGIDYTVTGLIDSVRDKATVPSSKGYYDADIAKILSQELKSTIVPFIMSVREDHLLAYDDQDIDTDEDEYSIPTRSMGGKVKDVVLLDSSGDEINMERLTPEKLKNVSLSVTGFYFIDDKIKIYPDAGHLGNYDLRIKYFRRPNNIVLTTSAGKITAIDTVNKILTLDRIPSDWTTSVLFDLIKGTPSFRSHGDDLVVTLVDSVKKQVTFSATLPTDLAVGDWCCEQGEAPLAQIPYDLHELLCQRSAMVILKNLGDSEGLRDAADLYLEMKESAKVLLTPRADGSVQKINRSGRLFEDQH